MYRWIEVMDHAPITMIDELERNCCILMHLTFVYSYIASLLVELRYSKALSLESESGCRNGRSRIGYRSHIGAMQWHFDYL